MTEKKYLSGEFYLREDLITISKDLLGKYLFTEFNGELTGGMIIETEAYRGPEDQASHAFGNRRTKRNESMYHEGGICYIYLCYGLHALFNVVTNHKDIPHAALIRALKPTEGIDYMLKRRKRDSLKELTSGPGTLTQALGIHLTDNGTSLKSPQIWLEDRGIRVTEDDIIASPRVGVDYAGEHAKLPWRFRLTKAKITELNLIK